MAVVGSALSEGSPVAVGDAALKGPGFPSAPKQPQPWKCIRGKALDFLVPRPLAFAPFEFVTLMAGRLCGRGE